jgi:hypothetical protein
MKILVSSMNGNLTMAAEFVPIVKSLEKAGAECLYLVESYNEKIFEKFRTANITYEAVTAARKSVGVPTESTVTITPKRRKPKVLRNLVLFPTTAFQTGKLIYATRKYFEKSNIASVVLAGDRHLGIEPALIWHARRRKIPIIVIQIAVNDKRFLARNRADDPIYEPKGFVEKTIARLMPRQVMRTEFTEVFFFPLGRMLALAMFGLLPKDPWNSGNSFADKYLVTLETYRRTALDQGYDKQKVHLVGQMAFDQLYIHKLDGQNRKKMLFEKYFPQLGQDTHCIVFGMPQFFEHKVMDFTTTRRHIEYLLTALRNLSVPVLVSLHPKMNFEDYKEYDLSGSTLRIVRDERLSEIISICQFYVSCFTSTIPWASLVGAVPVFLDYFELKLDVSIFPGCIRLTEYDQFESQMRELLADNGKNRDSTEIESQYLKLDGKCEERIRAHIISNYKYAAVI